MLYVKQYLVFSPISDSKILLPELANSRVFVKRSWCFTNALWIRKWTNYMTDFNCGAIAIGFVCVLSLLDKEVIYIHIDQLKIAWRE